MTNFIMPQYLESIRKGDTVMCGNKPYRVQNDRGHLHIVVTENGRRKKITVKHKQDIKYNVFYHYVLEGVQQTHPCVVMEWWLKMYIANKRLPINVMQNHKITPFGDSKNSP